MSSNDLHLETAPHEASVQSTGYVMVVVVLALVPAIFAQVYYYGFGILINTIISSISCICTEALILKIRKKRISTIIRDNSALVTGVILALALPPLTPWYLTIIGSVFAIGVAKHCFGGLGHNIFNPAMAAFVFLLISAPIPLTSYVHAIPENYRQITIPRATSIIFGINKDETMSIIQKDIENNPLVNTKDKSYEALKIADGFTGSTFLIDAKHEQPTHNILKFIDENMSYVLIYDFQAKLVVAICFLLGGLCLTFTKIIDYRLPLSFITVSAFGFCLCNLIDPNTYLDTFYHFIFGATLFGAFFIVSDPATAVSKPFGAYIYGAFIGAIFVLIRNFGGYPDAIAFSVLLGNSVSPLISIMTRRRPFGANSKPGDLNDK